MWGTKLVQGSRTAVLTESASLWDGRRIGAHRRAAQCPYEAPACPVSSTGALQQVHCPQRVRWQRVRWQVLRQQRVYSQLLRQQRVP